MKSLAELATLAAQHVPSFKRPISDVCGCGGYVNCPTCGGMDLGWDNSPVALWFAAHAAATDDATLRALAVESSGLTTDSDRARSALTVILKAGGVDVTP